MLPSAIEVRDFKMWPEPTTFLATANSMAYSSATQTSRFTGRAVSDEITRPKTHDLNGRLRPHVVFPVVVAEGKPLQRVGNPLLIALTDQQTTMTHSIIIRSFAADIFPQSLWGERRGAKASYPPCSVVAKAKSPNNVGCERWWQ